MAYLHYDTFDFSRWSHEVKIPENNVARLMYYLDIVCTLIEYDERNLDRLRIYQNYQNITDTELCLLYVACATLEPDLLIGKVMFEDEDGDLSVNSIFIAGRNRRVKKVMAYRPEWLKTYYIRPMAALTIIFEEERRREVLNDILDTCTIS